jgi:hypothetical protein
MAILLSNLHLFDFTMEAHLTGLHDGNAHHDNPFVMETTGAKPGSKMPSFGDFLAPQQQKVSAKKKTLATKKCRKTKSSEMKTQFPEKQ